MIKQAIELKTADPHAVFLSFFFVLLLIIATNIITIIDLFFVI